MAVLNWDQDNQRLYETGVEKGVLYVKGATGYGKGVAWNGLTGITESPSGAEPTALYANNKKYLSLVSAEEFGGTIEAYTYPDEFSACNGEADLEGIAGVTIGQQDRKTFGLSYKTLIGNDVDGAAHGYKIHIVYNCLVTPSERAFETVNESPSAAEMSWEFTTTPENVEGARPTAMVVINTVKLYKDLKDTDLVAMKAKVKALEDMLYGTAETEPTLPSITEIAAIFKNAN